MFSCTALFNLAANVLSNWRFFFAIFTKILIQNMLEHLGHYINTTFQKHKKVTFLQFLSMSSALRNPLEKAWQPLSHQLEWKMMLTTLSLLKNTVFENHLKCLICDFSNFGILTNFCPIKIDLSGNTIWPKTSDFHKLAKMDQNSKNGPKFQK